MATVASFNVTLAASVNRFVAPIRSAERTWASLARTVQRSSKTMEESQRRATLASISLARTLTRGGAAMAATFSGLAVWGVRLAAQFEQSQIAFETLLGSADEARKFLSTLERFARRTPFAFGQLQDMARQMLAWGFARQQVEQMLGPIGDFVAAMGGGQETMDRVIRALGQMRARSVASAEEMLQLTEAGVQAWQYLADAIGVSVPEAMQLVTRRAVPAVVAINAILTGLQRDFAGAMERQSRTLIGRWEQVKDAISIILRGLGSDVIRFTSLGDRLAWLAESLGRFADVVSERGLVGALRQMFPVWLQPVIVGMAGAIAGALVPAVMALVKALRALAVAQAANLVLLGKWAIIGAAVAGAVWLLSRAVGGLGNLIRGTVLTWGAMFLLAGSSIVHVIGLIMQAIAIVVPALRGAADAVVNWALQQRQVAQQWLQTAMSLGQVADSAQGVAESGQQAANTQRQLADTMQQLTQAADDNLQSFDEVHQLQQEMAAGLPEIPVPEFPEIPAPPGVPDVGAGASPVAGLGSQIQEVTTAASQSMGVLAQAAQAMEQAASAARTAWDWLRSAVVSAWSGLASWASTTWASIRSAVSSGWNTATAAVAAGASSVASALSGAWAYVEQAAMTTWAAVRAAAIAGWQALPAPVRDAAAAVADAVSMAWLTVVESASITWGLVRAAVTGDWETVRALVQQGAERAVQTIQATWDGLVSWAAWLWATVRGYMISLWDGLETVASWAWSAVESALRTAWDSIRAGAEAFWTDIRDGLANAWEGLVGIASSVQAIRRNIVAGWDGLKGWASRTWRSIADTANGVWATLVKSSSRQWDAIRHAVQDGWAQARAIVFRAASDIRLSIAGMVQQVTGMVQQLHDSVVQWFEAKRTRVSGAVRDLVQSVTGAFRALYDRLVGRSIIPDLVTRALGWFRQWSTGSMDIIGSLTQRMEVSLSDAFDRILRGGLAWSGMMQAILQGVGDAARSLLANQIAGAVAQSLSSLGKWVVGVVRAAMIAVGALIKQAYAALLALFAWMGPFAPAAAAGVIAAGLAMMGRLAAQAVGLVRLAEGGIVTGPTVAVLGEGRRREAVIPLERDNVLAESIGDAVYEAMTAALAQLAGAAPGAGDRELVLRIDGTTIARALFPALEREAERRGLRLAVRMV